MATLREQKEAFVSGHAGTTAAEVSILAAAPVVLLALWRLLQSPSTSGRGLFHRARPTAGGLALEFAVLVLPQLAHLLGAATPAALVGAAAALAAALFATQDSEEWARRGRMARGRPLTELLWDSLSLYRASLMIITLICILGVDFPAFPRRFAKAETWGTGLMDAGVGSFVAASGLAHGLAAVARGPGRPVQWVKEGLRAVALLALGLGRLLVTRSADYQHHASEYGVHWNFFLTLAALRLLGLLLPWAARSGAAAAAGGVAVLAAHQYCLSVWRVVHLVHSEARGASLLSANKEGLLSLPGYWALQLLGTAAGHAAYRLAAAAQAEEWEGTPRSPGGSGAKGTSSSRRGLRLRLGSRSPAARPGQRQQQQQWWQQWQQSSPQLRLLLQLAAAAAALWLAYAAAAYIQPVSRRACNAAYVLWMLALNVQCVALFVGADVALPGTEPHLLLAVNGGMLPIFLAGNVLTGLINLSLNTLAASDATAAAVVGAYMLLLCTAAVLVRERQQRM